MTGSIPQIHRQHSTNMEKVRSSKLRRCSSADNQNSLELIVDDNQQKDNLVFKRSHGTSEGDSGTEEYEQQTEQFFPTTTNEQDDQLSVKSSGLTFDEGFSDYEREEDSTLSQIKNDLALSKIVPDETKKDFCQDTSVAFHGEFARLISIPLSLYHDVRYYLLAEEELDPTFYRTLVFAYMKLDNAKAQFKCPNPFCEHAWTSMRARITFSITTPINGLVILKILGQNCKECGTHSDALWYIDEVCRVMKNLAEEMFKQSYPDMLNKVDLTIAKPKSSTTKANYDPTQRKGKMYASHRQEFCEACRRGLCFA